MHSLQYIFRFYTELSVYLTEVLKFCSKFKVFTTWLRKRTLPYLFIIVQIQNFVDSRIRGTLFPFLLVNNLSHTCLGPVCDSIRAVFIIKISSVSQFSLQARCKCLILRFLVSNLHGHTSSLCASY